MNRMNDVLNRLTTTERATLADSLERLVKANDAADAVDDAG